MGVGFLASDVQNAEHLSAGSDARMFKTVFAPACLMSAKHELDCSRTLNGCLRT